MTKNVAGKIATFSLVPLLLLLFLSFPQKAAAASEKVGMKIISESPAVGRGGRWGAEIEIRNESGSPFLPGILEARSSKIPVPSPSAMNSWATGHMNLPTPIVLAQAPTPALAPGSSLKIGLEGSEQSLGSQWGPRALEFFFASSEGGTQISYNLNSFITVVSASSLPPLPLSLVYIDPGPEESDKKGVQNLISTGKGKVFLQNRPSFPPLLAEREKIQVIEDEKAEEEFKNASALEQPAQIALSRLGAMLEQAKEWQSKENLPKILVSSSPIPDSELAEGLSLGYKAALGAADSSRNISLARGKVTFLAFNSLLSALAGGVPSSAWAQAELTGAGRDARFVAQLSAMRGRKGPVIVEVSPSSLPLLSFLSGEGWIDFKTLQQDLSWPWPSVSPPPPKISKQAQIQPPLPLAPLFSSLSPDGKASEIWANAVEKEAKYAQLCSYSQNKAVRSAGRKALSYMKADLGRCVNLSVSDNITVLSESASLPVTVKNLLPFPINARVRSLSSNSQITVLPEKESEVGSEMESQIDFPVRIHSSIHGKITFWMGGFYHPVTKISTQLNSHLTVTRLNVTILIIPAGLLTIFGCIRQVRRKKKNG